MVQVLNFYVDDSGTRHPDHQLDLKSGRDDWFALGGVLVRGEDELPCRELHRKLCERWGIVSPLHSEEIRHFKKNFRWLRDEPEKRGGFFRELETMLLELPVIGHACVIDRPGYHLRYHARYGPQKWSLCRTSFAIAVERASKYARAEGRKLNVFVEKSDRKTDARILTYFEELKGKGHPFDAVNAAKYDPLIREELAETLYDIRMKAKSSPMMQLADLYLYPICKGIYAPSYHPYDALRRARKLIDAHVIDPRGGIKYFCFDRYEREKTEAGGETPSAPGQPSREDLVG